MLNMNRTSRTIRHGIWHKSQQLQFVEIRNMVSVDPAWNILTCASQNMDAENLKLVALKITPTYTKLMKRLLVSLHNSSTLFSFFLDNSALKIGNCCWLVLFSVFPGWNHKENSVNKRWTSSVPVRVLTLSFVIPLPYNLWRRVFRSVAIFLFAFALFRLFIKSSWPRDFRRCLFQSLH